MVKINPLIKTSYDVVITNYHIIILHYDLHNTDDHSGSDKQTRVNHPMNAPH